VPRIPLLIGYNALEIFDGFFCLDQDDRCQHMGLSISEGCGATETAKICFWQGKKQRMKPG
jgi:hypothetical protein